MSTLHQHANPPGCELGGDATATDGDARMRATDGHLSWIDRVHSDEVSRAALRTANAMWSEFDVEGNAYIHMSLHRIDVDPDVFAVGIAELERRGYILTRRLGRTLKISTDARTAR